MRSPRPFRDALDPTAAIEELERQAGRQFDPAVVVAARRELLEDAPAVAPR
jgi:HD-GYP domain-containing protein (c-di-GMP phosphodiesterase class II)